MQIPRPIARLTLAACILLGVLGGVGAYTFFYAEGLSYLSNDPKACVNCHVMNDNFNSWQMASHHANATCNDCHLSHNQLLKYFEKARNGWNHSKAFTLGNFPEPIRITPHNLNSLQHNCVECHEVAVSEIMGHRDVERKDARCTVCHRASGHLDTL